jgi:hypothetical protein
MFACGRKYCGRGVSTTAMVRDDSTTPTTE